MGLEDQKVTNVSELIEQLDKDRSWLLEQIDRGRWPELRPDLAALERELSQLLSRTAELLDMDEL